MKVSFLFNILGTIADNLRALRDGSHCGLIFSMSRHKLFHKYVATFNTTRVIEVARARHKRYLKPDCKLLIFHREKCAKYIIL